MAMEDPAGLPPVVQLPVEPEDPRQVGRGFVPAPDWEQQGRPGIWSEWRLTVIAATVRIALVDLSLIHI